MSTARHAACVLLLVTGSGAAHAQIVVPAGAALQLAGATLDAGCTDVAIGGSIAIGSGRLAGARNVAVAGGGALDGGSGLIGLSGDFGTAGTFVPATGTVQVGDGCGAATSTFSAAGQFYNLSAGTATGHGLVFAASLTQSVSHALSLAGASGALLTVRSNAPGTAANLALAAGATQSVTYVDVADNHATVQAIGPGGPAPFHSIKGPNSDGWFMSAVAGPSGLLNDTGRDRCVDNSTNDVACAAANTGDAPTVQYPRQDGRFGRDAAATNGALVKTGGGAAGFDFTPLDATGAAIALVGTPPVPAATPACVRDNVTNLVWEVKTADGGLRDRNWYYTWFDGTSGWPDTGAGSLCLTHGRCDTAKYASDVNGTGLCGYNAGWRLPNRRELIGIIDFGTSSPAIDGNYFPNTVFDHAFWTSSGYAIQPPNIWAVEFQFGTASGPNQPQSLQHVRLVHDGP